MPTPNINVIISSLESYQCSMDQHIDIFCVQQRNPLSPMFSVARPPLSANQMVCTCQEGFFQQAGQCLPTKKAGEKWVLSVIHALSWCRLQLFKFEIQNLKMVRHMISICIHHILYYYWIPVKEFLEFWFSVKGSQYKSQI